MAKKYSSKKLNRIWEESMKLFMKSQSAQWPERQQCLSDRRFAAVDGAQWEEFSDQFENRPKLQVNKLMSSIDRVLAEMKRNPVSVKFVSKDGSNVDMFANTASSMFRADEQDSFAHEAYNNASADAVMGGFGAYRLTTKYANEFDEEGEQRIIFEPIVDADTSVFFDLGSKRKDKSDAKHCWVIDSMPIETFEETYPDRAVDYPEDGSPDVSSILQMVHNWEFDWFTPAVVRIVEHYFIEQGLEDVQIWTHASGDTQELTEDDFEDDDGLRATLRGDGWKLTDTETRKVRRVHKTIEDGNGVIEDCGVIAGKYIPIVPQYGKRFYIENVERCQGVVRLAKDVQRLLNMEISLLAQIAGSSSFKKPVFAPEQIAKYKEMYETDNIKQFPYLLADPLRNPDGSIATVGPMAMIGGTEVPPALGAIYQQTQNDIKDVMGQDKDAVTVQSNVSGEAVKLILDQINLFALSYLQERADAVKHGGVIWFWMAKDIYVENDRKMKAVGPDGAIGTVKLNQSVTQGGVTVSKSDFSTASLDVVATIEPALVSKKAEMTRSLIGLLQYTQDPQVAKVLQLEIIKNTEGSELSGIQEWARKQLVQAGAETPNDQEKQEMSQPKPPSAQEVAMKAYAEKQTADAALAKSQIEKVKAEAQKTLVQIDEIKANILVALKNSDQSQRELIIKEMDSIHAIMQGQAQLVSSAQEMDPQMQAQKLMAEAQAKAQAQGGDSAVGSAIGRGIGTPHL